MKKLCSFLSIVFIMLIMTFCSLNVFAVDDIEDVPKTLTVHFYVQIQGVDTPIEGAEVSLYKIANMSVKKNNVTFSVSDKYNLLKDTVFDGMSVSDSMKAAEAFSKSVSDADYKEITDKNGNSVFNIADPGVYLVKQTNKTGKAVSYNDFVPYIILVPFAESNGSEWQYDVLSEPKITVTAVDESSISDEPSESSESSVPDIPDQPSDVVLTGDKSNVVAFVCIGFLSVLLIICLIPDHKNDKKGGR
jgi:hypothetical protein